MGDWYGWPLMQKRCKTLSICALQKTKLEALEYSLMNCYTDQKEHDWALCHSKAQGGKLLNIILFKNCHVTWVKLVYYYLSSLVDAQEKNLQHTTDMNEPFVNAYLGEVNIWKCNNACPASLLEFSIHLAECVVCYYEAGIEISSKYKFSTWCNLVDLCCISTRVKTSFETGDS